MASIIRRSSEGKITLHTPNRHEVTNDIFVRVHIDNYEVCLDREDIQLINEAQERLMADLKAELA